MDKKCLWCLKEEPEVSFVKKAHTIPKSLGGEHYNPNVCDSCNEFYGNKHDYNYSIEEALKETFNITRRVMLMSSNPKKQVGKFKSRFFDIRERNGKRTLKIESSFRFNTAFQLELCHAFKRGLYKLFLEELNRQKQLGYEESYNVIRKFARYNQGDLPVFYFNRKVGIFISLKREAESPRLIFDRMKYLYSNEKFVEIEFLGHVFGFPISEYSENDFKNYILESGSRKKGHFINGIKINKLTDIDLTMSILNR